MRSARLWHRPPYVQQYAGRQQQLWGAVAKIQDDLSASLGATVRAPRSASSLQLSIEHPRLKEALAAYMTALEARGLKDGDAIGYVAAINGRLVVADLYPSNGLFRKMWGKQLAAVATEAIGDKAGTAAAPSAGLVRAFLAAAESGTAEGRETAAKMFQETRDSAGALYNEARAPSGRWVHKNYLAK
jgi:hypothetical protein